MFWCDMIPGVCIAPAKFLWADGNVLGMPTGTPVSEGDLFWCDIDPNWCLPNVGGTTVSTHTQMFSVLRTGTGDLDVLAAGNLSMESPFGVYTAGTQSGDVEARYNQPRGRLSDNGSVLGSAGSDNEKWVDGGSDSLYQAWYPRLGGNLTIGAGGSVSGDVIGQRTVSNKVETREQVASVAVGNWLWRQGTGNDEIPTAWWINFGSYATQPLSGETGTAPYLVGFTGFGTLGGGNISLRAGADGGMLDPVGDGRSIFIQGAGADRCGGQHRTSGERWQPAIDRWR